MASRGKLLASGIIAATIQIVLRVVLPFYLLNVVRTVEIEGFSIEYTKTINDVTKWVLRLGFVFAGAAFFKSMSPKGSRRRAWFGLFVTMINVSYIYMFKFGGATALVLVFEGGRISLDISTLVFLIMGNLFLMVSLNIWDIVYNTKYYKDEDDKRFYPTKEDTFTPEPAEDSDLLSKEVDA